MCYMLRAALVLALVGSTSGAGDVGGWMGVNGGIGIASSGSKGSVGIGTLANMEPVWNDLKNSRFVEVPAWMVGIDLAKPGYKVQAGMTLYWDCPNYRANAKPPMNPDGCMCYIFQYKCAGCAFQEGGLGKALAKQTRSWEKFFCAPKFKFDDKDPMTKEVHHPMIAYRTFAPSGERVEVTLPYLAEYVLIGGDARASVKVCGNFVTDASCEHKDHEGQCEWDATNDECINRTCRKPFVGPSTDGIGGGSCTTRCVDADVKHTK